ncbi:MAG TPA: hypothetical protein VJ870_18625 [Amycolatopsis sp.]|nr:hypothetical protein [Amycolatopsis sp.]
MHASTSSIDQGVTHVRDIVLPALQNTNRFVGLSMLADRNSGRCIATSSWQSRDAMRASEHAVRPLRDGASQILGGTPHVEEWQIAVLHRDHRSRPGCCVRATWFQVGPAELDRAIDVYKMASLPGIEDLDGFCSASLLVNRATGRAVSSVAYDSTEAMQRNREQAKVIRTAGTEDAGAQVLDVCEFELALAHLRVPELA